MALAEREAEIPAEVRDVLDRISKAQRRSEEVTEHAERTLEELERGREDAVRAIEAAVDQLRKAGYIKP